MAVSLNDSLEEIDSVSLQGSEMLATPEQSPGSSSREPGKYFELDGEIGYLKGQSFFPVTNFSVQSVGYVAKDAKATSAEGFLLDVIPKDSVRSTENAGNDESEGKRESYYLTWKDMSTQTGIMNVIKSTKLWTAPLKEQYLPQYIKELCDNYAASNNTHRVFPIQGLGLQKGCDTTPTWVFGSNLQLQLDERKARRLSTIESPYCNIGSAVDALPYFNFSGGLDSGKRLRKMIEVQEKYMAENFPSALLVLGGVGLAVHYEQLSNLYDGVPLIMAYGKPVSGKSTAVEAAMAVIGQGEKIGECTFAGAMDLLSRQSLPYWWDDIGDFSILEKVAINAFNKSNKKTKNKVGYVPRTVPVMTMNPTAISKSVKIDKEKLSRTFSRVVVIPFTKLKQGKHQLERSLAFQSEMKEVVGNVVKSVDTMLELRDDFADCQSDELFSEVVSLVEVVTGVDMRTQSNYALLLYSTAKIIEKVGMKEKLFPILKKCMTEVVLPHHRTLFHGDSRTVSTDKPITAGENDEVRPHGQPSQRIRLEEIIKIMVKMATEQPEKGKFFLNPKFSARKCDCGDVLGISIERAVHDLKLQVAGDAIRTYVTQNDIGCNGLKIMFADGQRNGTHIRRNAFPRHLIDAVDNVHEILHSKGVYIAESRGSEEIDATQETEVPTEATELTEATVNLIVESKELHGEEKDATVSTPVMTMEQVRTENIQPALEDQADTEEFKEESSKKRKQKRKAKGNVKKKIPKLQDGMSSYFEPENPGSRKKK